jgi:AcrR family transcriptional regulator
MLGPCLPRGLRDITYHLVVSATDLSTRERILDVAFELFADVGFAGTTVTEIEKRAGLTGGSGGFYRHFHSKKDLLRPAIEREVARYMTAIEDARVVNETVEDPSTIRREWLEAMFTNMRLFDPLIRLMLTDGHRVPEVRDAVSSVLQSLGEQMSWQQHPELTACIVALSGYHLLSEVQGQPFQGFPLNEFIGVLANMTSEVP